MIKRAFFPMVLFAFGAGFFIWTMQSPFWQSLRQISGIMRLVHAEYVDADAVGYETLAESAIRGMVNSLDAYSRYMPARDFAHFEETSRQRYVGIGVEIERFDNRVTIVRTFPGGPAAEAGIEAGDQIVSVDGEDMREASITDVSTLLRGFEGVPALVGIHRPGTGEELEYELIRRPVDVASVSEVRIDPEGFGYIRISQFGERTHREFREALDMLEARNLRGLVIDLRDNPGGLLRTSKDVASEFFREGELIAYTQGRDPRDRQEYFSDTPARPFDYPLVVLINRRSASGSEIVAGALQDTGRAWVIGEKSYGKGSVQSVYAFRDGGGLRQTTALYYLPSGHSINNSGVIPDEEVKLSEDEERRLRMQSRHRDYLSPEEYERIFEHAPDLEDRQLEAALHYLRKAAEGRQRERV